MKFLNKQANATPIEDTVFAVARLAAQAKQNLGMNVVIDATIGSLYSESNQLVAFDNVFSSYDKLSSITKAKYASGFLGNENYRKQVEHWVFGGRIAQLHKSVIASAGGTGAISMCFDVFLDKQETVLIPEIGWGSYMLMADVKQLNYETYSLFDGNHFNFADFATKCEKIIKQQKKLVVVINDPCHNPTGYSMSIEEWRSLISLMNELSIYGECIIVNDIAYMDYSYRNERARDYMDTFSAMNENVMVVSCFSCSKSLTSYGLRLGAAIVIGKSEADVKHVEIMMEKIARVNWSNVANAAMENFVIVTTQNRINYEKEKQVYVDLLKARSDIVVQEAKTNELPIYPYHEGFFVTIAMPNNSTRNQLHELLLKEHIYTVQVNKGIRIAICSLSIQQCRGLAARIKACYDKINFELN